MLNDYSERRSDTWRNWHICDNKTGILIFILLFTLKEDA